LANNSSAIAGAYQGGNGGDDGPAGTPSKKGTPRKRATKKKASSVGDGDNDDDEPAEFGSAKKGSLNKVKGGRVTKPRGGGKGFVKQSDSDIEDEQGNGFNGGGYHENLEEDHDDLAGDEFFYDADTTEA